MNNKKIIILGVIALVVLGGIVWRASRSDLSLADQAASILGGDESAEESFPPIEEEFVLGNPEAPVTIIEYSSHFCSHCVDFHLTTMPLITDKYIKTGQVKFIPRRLSPSELGQTLFCAQEQGEFQQVDEYLFEYNQELIKQTEEAVSEDDLKVIVADWLKTMVANLGLSQESFDQCLDSKKYEERVIDWFRQAEEAGVTGTPTFFINDQLVSGNQPYSVFEEIIEQALIQ
ncbi:MAG: thioredoxin domain-containing protein [Candidatus Portnoybacteria bacterium]|nr:thioredoxin domain-containing protein [Candidatus Portnoybacteria bacterium]